jgi:hypothetical protein
MEENNGQETAGVRRLSLEGQLLDRKSLRSVTGRSADWNELVKALRGSERVKASVKEESADELLDHYRLAEGDCLTHLGQAMSNLSDMPRTIDDSRAIEPGQCNANSTTNQSLISAVRDRAWAIASQHHRDPACLR